MKLLQLILTGGRECDIPSNNDDHHAPEPGHGGSAESSIVQSILSISTGPVSSDERGLRLITGARISHQHQCQILSQTTIICTSKPRHQVMSKLIQS